MATTHYCIVKNCSKILDQTGISYHKLPLNEDERSSWVKFIQQNNTGSWKKWEIKVNSRICSRHFQQCCFEPYGKYRKIKPGHYPDNIVNYDGTISRIQEFYQSNHPAEPMELCEDVPVGEEQADPDVEMQNIHDQSHSDLLKEIHRLLSVIKERNHTIKLLRLKLQRYEKKLEPVHTNHHEFSQKDKFEELTMSLTSRCHGQKKLEYSQLLKEFSLKLHYYSPKAYNFIRESYNLALPHPRTFQKWTSGINTKPGIMEDALNFIKSRNQSSSGKIYYSLSFDEIHIRKQIEFNGQCMKGFIDYGGIAKCNEDKPATSALFVMANEINGKFKTPIGYILTSGLDTELFTAVIKRSLAEMNKCNAQVLNITFDGLRSNLTAAEALGANFDFNNIDNLKQNLKTYMIDPSTGNKVYFLLDACHMIKLMRNMLKAYGSVIDSENQQIEWSFFERLLKLQKTEGLRAANKITTRHVHFSKQKMKVNLAVQVLSSSVGASLAFCEKIGLRDFSGSQGTANFAKICDRLFDSMNSFPSGKGYKAALGSWNQFIWKALFRDSISYLIGLKRQSTNTPIYKTQRSTCIKGLIINMISLEAIMNEFVLTGKTSLRYLSTYKLSQDILELFFSALRQRFGRNNNPTALQLEFALRRMLTVSINPNLKANCTTQDSTEISRASPLKKFVCPSENDDSNEDFEFPSYTDLSNFVSNVVAYIAGFVGRNVIKHLDCEICIGGLASYDMLMKKLRTDFVLIDVKDNGGLFLPSDDLVSACRITESVIRSVQSLGINNLGRKVVLDKSVRAILSANLFKNLRIPKSHGHDLFGTHVLDLIKLVVLQYIKVRLHYIAKEATLSLSPVSVRNYLTKAVTFKGQ